MAYVEIERKFLMDQFPPLVPEREAEIEQGYLCHEPVIRIRRKTENGQTSARLCFKGKGTLIRSEVELDLDAEQYDQLRALLPEAPIRKRFRTYRLPDGHTLECSLVDDGEPTAFYYAEVEFCSEAEARQFVAPDFLGREVTEDPSYTMSAYAARKSAANKK